MIAQIYQERSRWQVRCVAFLVLVVLLAGACSSQPVEKTPREEWTFPEKAPMPSGVFSPLPGQGLFIARNYTRTTWQIELGDATLALPPLEPGRGYAEIRLDLEPGTYTWQAFAPEKDRALLTDEETHTLHGFAIHAGEVYFARVLSLAPGQHVIPYVVEPVLFVP